MTSTDQETRSTSSFAIRDCALMSMATGIRIQTLREMRDQLQTVDRASIYHHFWGRLLQPQFVEQEYNNDFASWVYRSLHEKGLAERLSMVNPANFENLEDLRQELVDLLEDRLDKSEFVPWCRRDEQFHFIKSQVVVLSTDLELSRPEELAQVVPSLSKESIFYHFIDARRRIPDGMDDFSAWMGGFGDRYQEVIATLMAFDPYFSSLIDIRRTLTEILQSHLGGERR